jgi:transcriptional regulator with XRE-family HTH domain
MNLKLKSLMMRKGITGREIARRTGVSETWVSLVINNKKKSTRIRNAIARALGRKVKDLWPSKGKTA